MRYALQCHIQTHVLVARSITRYITVFDHAGMNAIYRVNAKIKIAITFFASGGFLRILDMLFYVT